jgi:hypothetical protein
MSITNNDRLNLLSLLSRTDVWETLPRELKEDEIGLDRERWMIIIQKLIDNENPTPHTGV